MMGCTQAGPNGVIEINPKGVEWNFLVQSLQAPEVLEHQGWIGSDFYISKGGFYMVRCRNIHTVIVDHDHMMAMDLYGTGEGGGVVDLEPGAHVLRWVVGSGWWWWWW